MTKCNIKATKDSKHHPIYCSFSPVFDNDIHLGSHKLF